MLQSALRFAWLLTFSLGVFANSFDDTQPRMVVVIDDLGNNLQQGQASLALPGPVTYAFLPHTRYSEALVQQAHSLGKEVMLHAPMENTHQLKLGPGALTESLSETEFKRVLNESLQSIPYAVGINNHMGSLLTQQALPMQWVMDIVAEKGIFFLDSRTTAKSVAWDVAKKRNIPVLQRDVFLDHEQTPEFLQQQFFRAVHIARKYGSVIVIGHPYAVTTSFLEEAIPALDEAGIQLVSASALLLQQKVLRDQLESDKEQILSECDTLEGHECR